MGIYSQCQECMGPLPDGPSSDDPFCSDECERLAEEQYMAGGGEDEGDEEFLANPDGAVLNLVQRYGTDAIFPHLWGPR